MCLKGIQIYSLLPNSKLEEFKLQNLLKYMYSSHRARYNFLFFYLALSLLSHILAPYLYGKAVYTANAVWILVSTIAFLPAVLTSLSDNSALHILSLQIPIKLPIRISMVFVNSFTPMLIFSIACFSSAFILTVLQPYGVTLIYFFKIILSSFVFTILSMILSMWLVISNKAISIESKGRFIFGIVSNLLFCTLIFAIWPWSIYIYYFPFIALLVGFQTTPYLVTAFLAITPLELIMSFAAACIMLGIFYFKWMRVFNVRLDA